MDNIIDLDSRTVNITSAYTDYDIVEPTILPGGKYLFLVTLDILECPDVLGILVAVNRDGWNARTWATRQQKPLGYNRASRCFVGCITSWEEARYRVMASINYYDGSNITFSGNVTIVPLRY